MGAIASIYPLAIRNNTDNAESQTVPKQAVKT